MKYRALQAFEDRDWTHAFIFWLAIAFVLHLCAAIFSVGYYHTDEHFQILEFLSYKLGRSDVSDLPIEFREKIRPWFQPALDYGIARTMIFIGLKNPFQWALVFRLVSSLLGWFSLIGLSILSYSWFEDRRVKNLALILCGTLWYLPALHARHSSESMSGAVFYTGASLLFIFVESTSIWFSLLIGALFGAAFLFRYQVAFLVIGASAYYVLRYRPRLIQFAALSLGILGMIALGVRIDHWGYGEWTFTPWNYFHYNLILGHVADIDTMPVWDFFRSSLTETFPPLGLLTLIAAVVGWIACPIHLLTAITFPLYLIHSIIGHKELRFIFPIAFAGPFLIPLAASAKNRIGTAWFSFWQRKPGQGLLAFFFAINVIALFPSTFLPCWMPARLYEQIYRIKQARYPNEPMQIYYKDKNPFEILGIPLNFYKDPETYSTQIPTFATLEDQIGASSGSVWFFQIGFELPPEAGLLRDRCHLAAQSLPPGFVGLIQWGPVRRFTQRVTNWTLFECSRMFRPTD